MAYKYQLYLPSGTIGSGKLGIPAVVTAAVVGGTGARNDILL